MPRRELVIYAVILAGLVALPFTGLASDSTLTLCISLFTVAGLAASWNILAGFAGRINLGHTAFFGTGALATRLLWLDAGWSVIPAFLAGGIAAALVAVVVGAPALRLKGIYFAVGTLALAEALRLTVGTILPRISRLPGAELRAYDLTPRYFLFLIVVVAIAAVIYWLRHSKLGLGMMASREDEDAAESIGVDTFRYPLVALVLSASLAGFVGAAFAYYHVGYYLAFTYSPEWTFDALLVTFVGGIGTLAGPLLGALFFVLISDVLASNLVNVHLIIFGALFILVVLALPGGIVEIGERMRRRLVRSAPPAVEENV